MNSVNCRAFFLLEPRNYALTPLQSNEEPSIVFRVYIRVLAARNRGFKQGAYLNHDAYTRFRGGKNREIPIGGAGMTPNSHCAIGRTLFWVGRG
ncbi:MAG: hypothetical protein ACERKY_02410 [Anaerolineales bacterium]